MQVSKRLLLSHLLQHTHLHTYPQNGTFPFKHNLKSQLIKTCQNDSQHSEHPQYLPNLTQVLVEGVIACSHKGNNSLMVEGQPRESGEISNYPEMLAERQAGSSPGRAQQLQHYPAFWRGTASQGITQSLPLAAPATQQTRDKAFPDWLHFFCLSGPENNLTSMLSKHL